MSGTETTLAPTTPPAGTTPPPSDHVGEVQTDLAHRQEDSAEADSQKTAEKAEGETKERSPEERERIRQNRRIERLLQQRAELRAQLAARGNGHEVDSTPRERRDAMAESQSDNETLQLSRHELQKLIAEEAKKLAPTIKQQEAEVERRRAVVQGLAKELGSEKFDALSVDLDDAFGGLADANGRPKPATEAIFEADDPRAVIEYLADPGHADEAEALGRMGAIAAGRAIAKLETKLAAEKAKAKPQPSKAAAPIEPLKGQGKAADGGYRPDMTDAEFAAWRRKSKGSNR